MADDDIILEEKETKKKRRFPKFLQPLLDKPWIKNNSRRIFWAWITYHCIKGALTTSLIWVPLIYALWGGE